MLFDGEPADVAEAKIETMAECPAHGFQSTDALVSYLRADSIATQYGDIELHLVPPDYQKPDTVIDESRGQTSPSTNPDPVYLETRGPTNKLAPAWQ